MRSALIHILDWSEVWSPLIPLAIFLLFRPKHKWIKPILVYQCIALFLNMIIDVLFIPYLEYQVIDNKIVYEPHSLAILDSNHVFYNLHSLARFACFAWFFNYLHPFFKKLNRWFPAVFFLVIAIYYIFLGSIWTISSSMMALETASIVVYCISWFNIKIHDDNTGSLFSDKSFWIVIGISLYSCVNFFIFLFFKVLIEIENVYAFYVWDVHNVLYILMCISFALAFSKK